MNTKKIKVGITGQSGFVGTHLYSTLKTMPESFERIPFESGFFENTELFTSFVKKCDVIVHLAAINRCPNANKLYKTNIELAQKLITVLEEENRTPHVIFSSSTQECLDNPYGNSKLECRKLFEAWAKERNASFTGMIIPNIYGPFGLPNYNSFIATFCHKLTHDEEPEIITDSEVNLVYIASLCNYIVSDITKVQTANHPVIKDENIHQDFTKKVSEILMKLNDYKALYLNQGIIPSFAGINEINLFNTFRSYIDLNRYFPSVLKQNTDERGTFVETIKLGTGGQVSFSTTKPGVTRGNHYHTRKIERFTVIKGRARIQLRRIGTDTVYEYYLDGAQPSYVDMPIWFTHNITNIGTDDLYTQFWINEWHDAADQDTFFEDVAIKENK
ncbi:epimerase [Spirochaetia bacterium]|nr:epimerase [Spirochaetia bacterium]